jgi:carboxyl-terminal processing protease
MYLEKVRMKQKMLWLLLSLATWAQGAALDTGTQYPPELKPERYEARAAHMAAELLSRYHYRAMPLDQAMSGRIFDQYLKSLDSEKLFFVQADVDRFSGDRSTLGDAILREDLSVPFSIFNLYERRAVERFAYARNLLKQEFDFKVNESLQTAREKQAWAQTESEIAELWRKRVKNDWLRLKIAGKDDKSIAETLDKRYELALKRIGKVKSADAFQTFMNAYTTTIEPHTNYMGPRDAKEFDISMRLSLIGIGAVLVESDEYTTIRELVAGGPASLSRQLKVGDRIVGVGQGAEGPMTDIMGFRQDDAVALIRGPADTIVRLDILPAEAALDGKHELVSLVRKPINLQEQAAKSSVQSIMQGNAKRRIGVISLPSFYEDFAAKQSGTQDFKSATRDVASLIEDLKRQRVDGVLVDLRNNGGGSLEEAVKFTGLFIGKGPVVQQRSAGGNISVERDPLARVAWNGPLGVLINRGSASASEIFAAAIQDYGRGLIIGEPSFGKGTVQAMIDLDGIAKSNKPLFGELKMTVAQFFRVNGGTTQLRGVTPDILFPGFSDDGDFGESSLDNALPWTQIKAADYSPAGGLGTLVPILLAKHEARAKVDKDFRYLKEDISEMKLQRKRNVFSLNEAERRKEREAREALLASREAQNKESKIVHRDGSIMGSATEAVSTSRDDGLQSDERNLAKELATEKVRKNSKDVLLIEAARILSDQVGLLEISPKLADRTQAAPYALPH